MDLSPVIDEWYKDVLKQEFNVYFDGMIQSAAGNGVSEKIVTDRFELGFKLVHRVRDNIISSCKISESK